MPGQQNDNRTLFPSLDTRSTVLSISSHSLPPVSFHKKKLAKRPGYMRPEASQQIEFQPPADCEPFNPKGLEHGRKHCEDFKNCSLHRLCKNDFEFLHCNSSVNSTIVTTNVVTTSTIAGNTTGSLRNLSDLRIQPSENVILPVCPAAATCKRDFSPLCSSDTWQTNLLAPTWETIHGARVKEPQKMYTLDQKEVNNNCEYNNKEVTSYSSSTWDSFNSSFSFIQLSLNSSFEKSDTEGQSDGRATEHTLQTNATGQKENDNLHEPGERLRSSHKDIGASSCICRHGEDYQCARETIVNDKLQDCEMVSLSDTDAAFSCSTDSSDAASAGSSVTSGYESSFTVSDHNWDTLMRKYEPVLLDCLVDNRSTLKIKSLMLRLQRLQEKAIEEDEYDKGETFSLLKLEELEREKNSLKFQLPSRHPSIISFLDRFSAQVQAALTEYPVVTLNINLWQKNEQKLLSPAYQKRIQVSTTKRNQLLQEKQWLQKEIEDLRARLAVLEAKDQQLRRDIEEQDRLIQSQDCELTALLSCVSLRELQEISKALDDTLASSYQIPFSLDLPGTIKSLQEKEQSLSMSIKETTAKVCASQKLCSTLRRKVSDIETQLPALLEAKMLAVSGKVYVIRDMMVITLTTAFPNFDFYFAETNVKENAVKFMEMLEDKLHSCGNQLLERVWEADLEACQLLIQGFQLKEAGCCVSEGEEGQTDEMDAAAADDCSDTERGKESHFLKGTERGGDFHLFSAELGEKCEAISEKLVQLEDQLQTAVSMTHTEDLWTYPSLQREIQMVKETLQAMLMQLQPDKKAGEDEAGDFLCDSWCPGKQDLKK
uniref:DISC1 scaffold protein n=1 Tax=Chelydra serpentina TaxID=8475 RepID=A0A8C3SUA5_CHESE